MTDAFGDTEPLDEWDDMDSFRVRLAILETVFDELRALRHDGRRLEALRLARKLAVEQVEDITRLERLHAALEAL